eukprot:TRINITY_DN8114_c0_g1_i2.p1 TRINITY_DN8114_c0_g1~~TRINITY_DN8114_c0_g1_i2.p1  ORF type:complete len:279 (+),score=50.74 TRINITY_DN8114_c0_g1_i2:65-901(+)
MCIRDRVSTQSTWGKNMQMDTKIVVFVYCLFILGSCGLIPAFRPDQVNASPNMPTCDYLPEQQLCDELYRQCRQSSTHFEEDEQATDALKVCLEYELNHNMDCLTEVKKDIPCYKKCLKRCSRRTSYPLEWNGCLASCDLCKKKKKGQTSPDDEGEEADAIDPEELCTYIVSKCNDIVEQSQNSEDEKKVMIKDCDGFQDKIRDCQQEIEKQPECYEACISDCDRSASDLKKWGDCITNCYMCSLQADTPDPFGRYTKNIDQSARSLKRNATKYKRQH